MEPRNQTFLKEFILVGFSENMGICILFFVALLLLYLFTIFGNSFLITTVLVSSKLHRPMYFFLCNLSILDLCYASSSIPKVLMVVFSKKRTISFTGCMVQMYTGLFLGCTEDLLLAVMAYDRYVAICASLHYYQIMNWKMCRLIAITLWLGSFLISVLPTASRPLVFCTENKLDHFVCEMLAVQEIACGNVLFYKVTLLVLSLLVLFSPFVFIVVSYTLIISSILKIKSGQGRAKAFSTCASHLIVVSMFYGTCLIVYTGQRKSFFPYLKYVSLIYGVITPVLNPLIYSLRNNDVKESFMKILKSSAKSW